MRWEGHVARMGDKRRDYGVLVRKGGLRKRENLHDIGVDGRTIRIMGIQEVAVGSMDWSVMAQDRGRCRLFVNAERTFVFHKMWGIS
jgi:hypothetical protein